MNSAIRCIIFDLDGVLVHTDRFHEDAWRTIAREEGIPFDPGWPARLRGVDRMQSLEIMLEGASRPHTQSEKDALAERKNQLYRRAIAALTPRDLAPGGLELISELRGRDIRIAIASSSRNAGALIDRLGLRSHIDAVADGTDAVPAKPDPALFLLAAQRAGVPPSSCVVIEDSEAGMEAARRAGMQAIFLSVDPGRPRGTGAISSMAALRAKLLPD